MQKNSTFQRHGWEYIYIYIYIVRNSRLEKSDKINGKVDKPKHRQQIQIHQSDEVFNDIKTKY